MIKKIKEKIFPDKSDNVVVKLIIIFTIFQPLFDILIFFARDIFGTSNIILSFIRPFFCLLIYIFILLSKKVPDRYKKISFIYLFVFAVYCLFHLTNIYSYIVTNKFLTLFYELRYLLNCGYYLLQLFNLLLVFKISTDDEKKYLVKSIVYASMIMFLLYFVSIVTKTSGLTYPNSIKNGYKGWSVSAHYIGHCSVYMLPIILISVFEKKYFNSFFKYIIILLPVIAGYYCIGTKTAFFGIAIIVLTYTFLYFICILLKKKKIGLDFYFLLILALIMLLSFNKTSGYKNFNNQIEVSKRDIIENKLTINYFSKILDSKELEDISLEDFTENMKQNAKTKKIFENIFVKRLLKTSYKLRTIDYAIFDNRDVQIKYNNELRKISPIKDKLLGYGYFTIINSLWVETDTLGIFYSFGLVGFLIILLIPIIYIFKYILFSIFDFKNLTISKLLFICAIALNIAIITICGYTMFFSQTVYYFILILVLGVDEFSRQNYKGKHNYLFMINDLNVGGAEVGLVDVINELVKEDTVDLVLLRKRGDLLNKVDKRVKIYEILNDDYSKLKKKIFHALYFMGGIATKYVYKHTIEYEYDTEIAYIEGYPAVFIANSSNPNSKKVASIRVGLKRHSLTGEKIPFGKYIIKNAYKKIDEIYTVSEETTKEFIEKYPFCESKTSTIYTYFNKEYIKERSLEPSKKIFDKECINFLAVGRFNEQKSYDRLVEAFRKLKENYKNVKLHILGKYDTSEGKKIIELINKYNLGNDILLHGVVENPYPYMRSCDALVSSSLYEGYPRVINEALCLKTLCIGTDVTGTREALSNNKGILVSDSVEGIFDGMSKVCSDKKIIAKYKSSLEEYDGNKAYFFRKFKQVCSKKKSLAIFCAKISYGGLEKALVNFINENKLNDKYDLTLYLIYYGKMNYLNLLPKNIKIKVACSGNWDFVGKIKAILRMFALKLSLLINKHDISICYTHHHPVLASYARMTSKNSIVFIHSNIYNGTTKKQQRRYKKCKYDKFKKIICVSNDSKKALEKMVDRNDIEVLNNIIDGEYIEKLKDEEVDDFTFSKNKIYFVNVGRHDEEVKKITRIINATKKLNKSYKNFEVLLIGDGPSDNEYKSIIANERIKNIHLLGRKSNPYKYMTNCDAILTSSIREGNPVVFVEAKILNIPIITTDVSDAKIDIHKKYGIVVQNTDDGIYEGMKKFLDEKFTTTKKFDYKKFNNSIKEKTAKILDEVSE